MDSHKVDLNSFPANRIHVLQNRTKINPKILEMVSEYEYDVVMFMMLCTNKTNKSLGLGLHGVS